MKELSDEQARARHDKPALGRGPLGLQRLDERLTGT